MSELQDELDKYDGKVVDGRLSYTPKAFVEAARLVANIDPKPFARYERLGGISLESCDPEDADVWIVDVTALTPGTTNG